MIKKLKDGFQHVYDVCFTNPYKNYCTKGLVKKGKEFKNELDYFLEKTGKNLEGHSKESIEFLLNFGSAIYSTSTFVFGEEYLKDRFWEEWGQYMNKGEGYPLPENFLSLVREVQDLEVIKIKKRGEIRMISLTPEYLQMREDRFRRNEFAPSKRAE